MEHDVVAATGDLAGTQPGPSYDAGEFRREMLETRLELCAQMREIRLELCAQMREIRLELCAQMRADTRVLVFTQIAMTILVMITVVRFS